MNTLSSQISGLIGPFAESADGQLGILMSALSGVAAALAVALSQRTADRVLVVNLPGKGTFEFRLRLPAEPHRSEQIGPWHLADRIASPNTGAVAPLDAYTIRYRVL